MFASQWFLTLFTAKFPLNFVYQVVDIFLSEVSFQFDRWDKFDKISFSYKYLKNYKKYVFDSNP